MLYTPVPGTPLYQDMQQQQRMLPGIDLADIHGQHKFNFQHSAISRDDSNRFLESAFARDFEGNGPSLYRICRTTMQGWKRYKNDPDPRVRERFSWEVRSIKGAYCGLLWAMERQLRRTDQAMSQQIRALREEIGREFGVVTRVTAGLLGRLMLWTSRREQKRLAEGKTYEPKTFIEHRNWKTRRTTSDRVRAPSDSSNQAYQVQRASRVDSPVAEAELCHLQGAVKDHE